MNTWMRGVGGLSGQPFVPSVAGRDRTGQTTGTDFRTLLSEQMDTGQALKFSKHALERMNERGIGLDAAGLTRLENGVARAQDKGARDSLMILDGTAMIVNIPSKTVVTCMDTAAMRDHVFTNIDSAALV
jgi:flagellar operon protein